MYPRHFWITHLGEVLDTKSCCDHNNAARLYVQNKGLLYDYVEWAKITPHQFIDYRSFALFHVKWIRVTSGINYEDGTCINIAGGLSRESLTVLDNYVKSEPTAYYSLDISFETNDNDENFEYHEDEYKKLLSEIRRRIL